LHNLITHNEFTFIKMLRLYNDSNAILLLIVLIFIFFKKYLAINTYCLMLPKAAGNSTAQTTSIMMHFHKTLLFAYEMRMNNIMSHTAQAYKHLFTL